MSVSSLDKNLLNLIYSSDLDIVEYLELFNNVYFNASNEIQEELMNMLVNNELFNFNESQLDEIKLESNNIANENLEKIPKYLFKLPDDKLKIQLMRFNDIYFSNDIGYFPTNNIIPFQYLCNERYAPSDFSNLKNIIDYIFESKRFADSYFKPEFYTIYTKDEKYGKVNMISYLLYVHYISANSHIFNNKEKGIFMILYLLSGGLKGELKEKSIDILNCMPLEIYDYFEKHLYEVKSNIGEFNRLIKRVNKNIVKYKRKTSDNLVEFYKNCFELNIILKRLENIS